MTNGELLDKLWDLRCTAMMCSLYHHEMADRAGIFFGRRKALLHTWLAAYWDEAGRSKGSGAILFGTKFAPWRSGRG